ncbi:hypothetical protein ACP70R_012100 [Stipagrostis hirtigluma subsp. patula]
MAGLELVKYAWKEWGLQALVLLSFTLQVMLLILAEVRRRIDSGVLRAFVWSAYMLADGTAIYVLGHLSATSRSPEHELMAFWAAFLLLHLGGQDNITAYAIEDNRLWPRHLQTLAVQVTAAAYVIYESSIFGSRSLLLPATVLTFLAGVVKYGERVWALRCAASSGSSGKNYDRMILMSWGSRNYSARRSTFTRGWDTEALLIIAHLLVDAPRDLLQGPLPRLYYYIITEDIPSEDLFKVVELQLSLMHDVFYTKSEVMHNWCGVCIRIISLLATAGAFFLFHAMVAHKGGYSRLDVSVSYVLLVGAVFLEIMSALRAMFSSWTLARLVKWYIEKLPEPGERNIWVLLGRGVMSLRRVVRAARWRGRHRSGGAMGQHNVFQLVAGSMASRRSKIARWMGVEDRWNTLAYSSSIPVSTSIKQLLLRQVLKSSFYSKDKPDHIMNSRGRAALESKRLYQILGWTVDPNELSLEESIMVWHMATDVHFHWYKEHAEENAQLRELAEAGQALSNYMLFLIAVRPYMLPPPASREAYIKTCHILTDHQADYSKRLMADLLQAYRDKSNSSSSSARPEDYFWDDEQWTRLHRGAKHVGQVLQDLSTADQLELIAQVWVEMLCYAGHRCSAYSHAKQLAHGGDLITVAALLVYYLNDGTLRDRAPPMPATEVDPAQSQGTIASSV